MPKDNDFILHSYRLTPKLFNFKVTSSYPFSPTLCNAIMASCFPCYCSTTRKFSKTWLWPTQKCSVSPHFLPNYILIPSLTFKNKYSCWGSNNFSGEVFIVYMWPIYPLYLISIKMHHELHPSKTACLQGRKVATVWGREEIWEVTGWDLSLA